jgi:hypothetical protein
MAQEPYSQRLACLQADRHSTQVDYCGIMSTGIDEQSGETALLYRLLAERALDHGACPPPDTTLTATIETIDNDRALGGIWGAGLPLP